MSLTNTKKLITFSTTLLEKAESKAESVGLSFPEYVRHTIVQDLKDFPIDEIDDETARGVVQSLKEIKEGKYVRFNPKNKEEMRKALS